MTTIRMTRLAGAAVLLCAIALPCAAADDEDAFVEAGWQTPDAPKDADLLSFYTGLTGLKFSIDAKSLTVGKDGVARYTMVAVSPGGAKNVSYEGLRCATMEHKLYAVGNADGSWTKARDPQWLPIVVKGPTVQHATLAKEYVCKDSQMPGKPDAIVNDMRYHRTPFSPQS
ncbi:MAG TPA: CNP1-like family protein [Burkholderiaceae bacterium]